MAALVVFESMFRNTRQSADAVAEGLSEHLPVEQVEVSAAPTVIGDDVELLVIGGPTHAFGLTRPGTRQSAAQQAEDGLVSSGPLVRGELERGRRWGEELARARGSPAITWAGHLSSQTLVVLPARAPLARYSGYGV